MNLRFQTKMNLYNLLFKYIGIDPDVILQCSRSTLNTCTSIGILVQFVTLLTYSGCVATTLHIFDKVHLAVLVGIILGWMISNIYTFIFIIFSATSLYYHDVRAKISLPKIMAFVYISFIALFVSIPSELLLFNTWLEDDISAFKKSEKIRLTADIEKHYDVKEKDLQDQMKVAKSLSNNLPGKPVEYYTAKLRELQTEKSALLASLSAKIDQSKYNHKKLEWLINKYPSSKLISLLFIALFLTPLLYILYTEQLDEYHHLKRSKDRQFIDQEYSQFKYFYASVLQTQSDQNPSWVETYIDPPYNTKKKTKEKPDYLSERDLLIEIYKDER